MHVFRELEQPELELVLLWAADIVGGRFILLCHNAGLEYLVLLDMYPNEK